MSFKCLTSNVRVVLNVLASVVPIVRLIRYRGRLADKLTVNSEDEFSVRRTLSRATLVSGPVSAYFFSRFPLECIQFRPPSSVTAC